MFYCINWYDNVIFIFIYLILLVLWVALVGIASIKLPFHPCDKLLFALGSVNDWILFNKIWLIVCIYSMYVQFSLDVWFKNF